MQAHPRRTHTLLITLLALTTACSPDENSSTPGTQEPAPELSAWFEDPTQEFPETLGEFGLFHDPQNLSGVPDEVILYEPAYPLWSNGSAKLRHLVIPEGTSIDVSQADWVYPEGTVFFKTFSFETARGTTPVETRVMRFRDGEWDWAHYRWGEDGSDATQLDMRRPIDVTVTLASGEELTHEIPNKLQCRTCHESATSWTLGFSNRQTQDAPNGLFDELVERGVLTGTPQPAPALDEDPDTAWVQGYMIGNCVHCHNDGDTPNSAYSLFPEDFLANTIDRDTEGNASKAGVRVTPGDAEASVLYQAMRGYEDDPELKAMPPQGVQVRDDEAIEKIRAWIDSLPASN